MKAAQIRRQFLDFFVGRRHREVPSSPLVPADDPTLLFTNAGMVQFKRVFQGVERRDYVRATSCQKCVRAGGKHNDLEQVGHTARHHTFFEMLGNFSFGDYFKRDAIGYAWEWVTGKDWLGIAPERLRVSVHHSDEEARTLWREVAGVPDGRIFGLSDKDNFWQMGETGPAGPCSEIYVDLRDGKDWSQALTREQFEELGEAGALVEIWNLVFMQYDLQPDGSRNPLPSPSVDTGAGLERIAAVLQHVPSNFDTDLFVPILERAAEVIGRPYDRGPAGAPFRVLADHARAVAFLLADGVAPSSEGRGYVLRRILRRGVRYAWQEGRAEPTLASLAERVIETMGDVYPDLVTKKAEILRATRAEEERFLETIEGGMRRLDELKSANAISGEEAFKLYDTYGFPLDLTQVIATERRQTVDVEGFEQALAQQRRRSRAARVSPTAAAAAPAGKRGEWVDVRPEGRQRFVGYESTDAETDVLAFRQTGDLVELVLQENPFYVESGGQVSDTGVVTGDGWELTVEDVVKENGKSAVVGRFGDAFEPTPVRARVNESRRRNIERNHTGTHLVHAALRKVLGPHVRQRGSLVAPERLRFDFSHHGPIDDQTLANIEEEVNGRIWENLPVTTREMGRDEAIAKGAMALFGEKYGERVRVVDIGDGVSLELCGGTHVPSTGQIALFRFTHETGAEAGVRRIEAITGPAAYRHLRELEQRLAGAARLLKAQPEHVEKRIEALIEERKKLEHQIAGMLKSGGSREPGAVLHVGDVELHVADSDLEDREQIALAMDAFRRGRSGAISVLFTRGLRPGIHVAVTDDLVAKGVQAGKLAGAIAAVSGGKGGGRPHFASAGAGDPARLAHARAETPEIVRKALAR